MSSGADIGSLHATVKVDGIQKAEGDLKRFDATMQSTARGLSRSGVSVKSSFDDMLSSVRRSQAGVAQSRAELDRLGKTADTTARSAGGAGLALKGIAAGAVIFGISQLTRELGKAEGGAGALGRTLESITRLDFGGVVQGIKDIGAAITENTNETLRAQVRAYEQELLLRATKDAQLNAKVAGNPSAYRAARTEERDRLKAQLGTPDFAKLPKEEQDAIKKAFVSARDEVNKLNAPVPVQVGSNFQLAESQARADGNRKKLVGILRAEVIRLKSAPDRLNLNDRQLTDLNDLIASKRSEIAGLTKGKKIKPGKLDIVEPPIVPLSLQEKLAIAEASTGTSKDDVRVLREVAANLNEQISREKDVVRRVEERQALATTKQRIASLLKRDKETKKPAKEQPIVPLGLELNLAQAELSGENSREIRALSQIAANLTARIRKETDINRKIEEVNRLAQTRARLVAAAESIKNAALDKLSLRQENLDTSRELTDAKEALRKARGIGGKIGIRDALRAEQDAQIGRERYLLQSATATASGNGTINFAGATFNIKANNIRELIAELQRISRTGGVSSPSAGGVLMAR